jgi:phosphomevalonate kinase
LPRGRERYGVCVAIRERNEWVALQLKIFEESRSFIYKGRQNLIASSKMDSELQMRFIHFRRYFKKNDHHLN